MGCDIHSFTEKKNPKTNKWEKITGFKSDYYDSNSDHFSQEEYKNGDSVLDARNYSQFAILADVRNGYGFAGCDTGDAIKPISMPKGLPKDVCDEIKEGSDYWDTDGHSHSWLTAKEINDYPCNMEVFAKRGWVTSKTYKKFLKTNDPYPYCGMVAGRDVMHVSNDDCEKTAKENPSKTVYTQIEWKETAKESASWLFGEGLEQLMAASSTKDGSDIRIVFWFDN